MEKFCGKCNQSFSGGIFCPKCGKVLTNPSVESVDTTHRNDENIRTSYPRYEEDNIIMDCSNMVYFDINVTASDVRYALFTIGPFRDYLPMPGVGADNAIDLMLVDMNGGKEFRPVIYYPKATSQDLQIRNGLRSFFDKHVRNLRDTRYITDEQFCEYVEGDVVRFFVDKDDKTKMYSPVKC